MKSKINTEIPSLRAQKLASIIKVVKPAFWREARTKVYNEFRKVNKNRVKAKLARKARKAQRKQGGKK
jgi:hypothetical protein